MSEIVRQRSQDLSTMESAYKMCQVLSKSDLVPRSYRGKAENVFLAYIAGQPFGWDVTMACSFFPSEHSNHRIFALFNGVRSLHSQPCDVSAPGSHIGRIPTVLIIVKNSIPTAGSFFIACLADLSVGTKRDV